ncbi:MAG: tetratricopeptide repeat protein [Elusimicrobiota bacterium]
MKITSFLLVFSGFIVSSFSYDKVDVTSYLAEDSFLNARAMSINKDKLYVLLSNKVLVYSSTLSYTGYFEINLENPTSIFADDDNIYIVDSKKSSVFVYDKDGKFIFNFGSSGSENGQLLSPSDLACFNGKVFVANTKNNSINVYDKNGIFLYSFEVLSKDGVTKFSPVRIAFDYAGNIYIWESKNKFILKYDINGKFISDYPNQKGDFPFAITKNGFIYGGGLDGKIREYDANFVVKGVFGAKGKNKYEFQSFVDIKPYKSGIFVLDSKNRKILYLNIENKNFKEIEFDITSLYDRIKIFPYKIFNLKSLSFNVFKDGILYFSDLKSNSGFFAYRNEKPELISQVGDGDERVKKVGDIAVMGDRIYVADMDLCKIKVFENMKYSFSFGDKVGFLGGDKDGRFSRPSKISMDLNEKIYVLDTKMNMIQVFNKDGVFLYSIDLSTIDKNAKFADISNDEEGNIILLSPNLKKIYLLSPDGKEKSNFELQKSINPISFAYDLKKYIFVLDNEKANVSVYDRSGDFISSFFAKGAGERELLKPSAIRYYDNRVYISDPDVSKISVFDITHFVGIKDFSISYSSSTKVVMGSFKADGIEFIKNFNVLKSVDGSNFKKISEGVSPYFNDNEIISGTTVYYKVEGVSITQGMTVSKTLSLYIEKQSEKKDEVSLQNRPPLEIIPADLKYIFSANYKYYLNNPIGKIIIKNNTTEKFENIKVSFFMKEYMDFPYDIIVEELKPSSTKEVEIKATLNNKILNINETTPVQSQITIRYYTLGAEKDFSLNVPIKILSKDSIVWDDTRRIANFITVKDPIVAQISKNLASKKDDFKSDVDPNVVLFTMFSNYLTSIGIKYVEDPVSPYKLAKSSSDVIIDTVLYPRNLLKIKAGDCDDLTALMASLLESVGVRVIIMDYPQHITLMFEIKSKDVYDSEIPGDMLIKYEDSYFVPVEVTMLDKPVYENIYYASSYYKAEKDKVKFYDLRKALAVYEPPTLDSKETEEVIINDELKKNIEKDLEILKAKNFEYYENYYNVIIKSDPQSISPKINLGILYASNMMMDKAENIFNEVLSIDLNNSSALNNLGNIFYLRGEYQKAIDFYNKAYKSDPYDANILVNISKTYIKMGKKEDAKLFFDKAVSIDPEIKKYWSEIQKEESLKQ